MAAPGDRPKLFGPLLIASDFAATVGFYRDILGMPVEGESPYAECASDLSRFSILDGRFWSRVHGNDMEVLPGMAVPPSTVLAIQVADVDTLFERLMVQQVRFLSPPTDRPQMGLRNAFLRDPDGRTVELTTDLRPRPPPR